MSDTTPLAASSSGPPRAQQQQQQQQQHAVAPPTMHLHLHGHLHQQHAQPAVADDMLANDVLFHHMCQVLLRDATGAVDPGGLGAIAVDDESSSGPSDESAGAHAVPRTEPSHDRGLLTSRSDHIPADNRGGSSSKRSQRQINLKLIEAEQRLKALKERHTALLDQSRRLKRLNMNVTARLEQAEFQQRMTDIVHRSPRSARLLPDSCSQVSFSELPPSNRWDATWIARIAALRPQDYLVLRRQWIQQSAVLLPQALTYGPESRVYQRLHELYNRYMDFVRALVTLAPSVWIEGAQFDLDTLRPISTPTAEWVRDMFTRLVQPQPRSRFVRIAREYHASTTALHEEYAVLLQRYNQLAAALKLQPLDTVADAGGSPGAGGAGAGADSPPVFGFRARGSHVRPLDRLRMDRSPQYMEQLHQLDEVAQLLQANTNKYKAALVKYFSTFNHMYHPNRVSFHLMVYPLAMTPVGLVPGLLLLSDPSSSDPEPWPQPAGPSPSPSPTLKRNPRPK